MTMITPSYLGETIEYSSLHACRSTLEDPTPVRRVSWGSSRFFSALPSDNIARTPEAIERSSSSLSDFERGKPLAGELLITTGPMNNPRGFLWRILKGFAM